MNGLPRPWDGQESVTDALSRRGLKTAFDLAMDTGNRDRATGFLVIVGVDYDMAKKIISLTLPPVAPG